MRCVAADATRCCRRWGVRSRVRAVVEEVRERSPQARIVLVNYPQLTPEKGCESLLLARGDNAYARQVAERLDRALRQAAKATDVELVDLWKASEGHEICSDEPWVNGPETDFSRALQFHPFAEGQQAVAGLVLEALGF
ncbi:GDSL-type esterase/lipase family protein [Nocardioides daphniae]|uniref:GDSL-type esterase/lipase family protein n=1 Tax=Nocardioides daphniae TaxID=402297 RepID=UPI001476FF04|nr:GDSL-type esterase/lipase family protein [Nocardioides daphniae]